MGQVDCWPMQCPPMLPPGVGSCRDTTAATFAEYNNPVADCCAPRCDSKAIAPGSSTATTTTAVTAADPCLQQHLQLQPLDDYRHRDGEVNDEDDDGGSGDGDNNHGKTNDDDGDNNGNNNNDTAPSSPLGQPCFYGGRAYQSGARWDDPVDMCTSCDCKVILFQRRSYIVIKSIINIFINTMCIIYNRYTYCTKRVT